MRHGAVLLATGIVVAGCGGGESSSDKAATTPAPTAAATKAAGSTGGAKAGTQTATIKDFTFKPATVTVAKGSKVKWTNDDAANHTVTFKSGPKGIDNLDKGQSGSVTFGKPGTYEYVCTYHPGMRGTVVVR